MLSSRARAPRESLRIQPEVSSAGSWLPQQQYRDCLARWLILRTLVPPGTAAPSPLIPRQTSPVALPRSFLHLHLSLLPPPPLLVLQCQPTPPFPSPTRISYSRESRLSSASRMSNGCDGRCRRCSAALARSPARVLGIAPSCARTLASDPIDASSPWIVLSIHPNRCRFLEPGAPLGREVRRAPVHRWSVPGRTVQCGAAGEDGLG
ncbi:hypothetical protein B0H13DRAFT_2680432, partial [Mycena leptocephala]